MLRVTTSSAGGTAQLGAATAACLQVGDVIAVRGELGTGKTVFIRGACEALGVEVRVTSPTFTIGHRYPADPDVAHLDLYRFESMSAGEWADIEPLFVDSVAFVEWPDVGAEYLPAPRAVVTLRHVDPERREIEITTSDQQLERSLAAAMGDASSAA